MNHSPYAVVLDACVLYPSILRDVLLRLGLTGLYQPKWTATIQDEWKRNLRTNRPDIAEDQLARTQTLMNKALPDAMVSGFEPLISGITLPDSNDCHVVAAAIRCKAEVIVTMNLKDFPRKLMAEFEIEALHPDEFIMDLFDLNQALVLKAVNAQRASFRQPAMGVTVYLDSLLRQGLPMTVSALDKFRFLI
ncbi:PIN domain-containing protein [Pantoea sp. DY-15]|uniref:PIN domain-containing protein n=1 Tax=unclassified Pantoea TaxID=2630326 RepID=UPI001C960686|nr:MULTISPECIES: PIN domain-containing protein [unclassified Pantoea]MBY4839735.1 PIN domain-containing protein [Pantoea sp. DY-5]MBY4888572.1 PIN domain-containing protein [Pantoea sp. DY-15]